MIVRYTISFGKIFTFCNYRVRSVYMQIRWITNTNPSIIDDKASYVIIIMSEYAPKINCSAGDLSMYLVFTVLWLVGFSYATTRRVDVDHDVFLFSL